MILLTIYINKKMSNITTIKLQKQTKERIEKLKEHKRETYDDILRKMLFILTQVKIDFDKAKELLDRIDEAQKRINVKEKQVKKQEKE